MNPQGVVPTLVIDGRPMVESVTALMTLADHHPEAKLVPAIVLSEVFKNVLHKRGQQQTL